MTKKRQQRGLTASDIGARAERLLTGVRPADRLTKEQRIERGRHDAAWFNRYYLSDYFICEAAEFHSELSELIETQKRFVGAAPREHAKSTTVTFAKVIHSICFELFHFVVIIRDTADVAKQSVDDVRQELEHNERLREDFGDLIGDRKWTESEFVTSNGIKVLGLGRGMAVRGLRYKQYRPDLVILDDIEDDESVESKQQRDKQERWLRRAVLNIIGPGGSFFMIGTILHHDSLLMRLLKQTDVFTTRVWKAIKENGKPLWPARWPMQRLEAKRKEIGARNFATEFMNDPANEEEQIFLPQFERRFGDDELAGVALDEAAAIDPAIGLKQKNDDSAIAVIGEARGVYYVTSIRIRKMKIQQQVDLVVATCQEHPKLLKFGFETIAYQDALKQLVDERSKIERLQIPAIPVDDISSDKLRRLSRMAPLWEQGLIRFPSPSSSYWNPDVEKCLEELYALGCSANAHDDGPDAVERAISLLRGKKGRKVRATAA